MPLRCSRHPELPLFVHPFSKYLFAPVLVCLTKHWGPAVDGTETTAISVGLIPLEGHTLEPCQPPRITFIVALEWCLYFYQQYDVLNLMRSTILSSLED